VRRIDSSFARSNTPTRRAAGESTYHYTAFDGTAGMFALDGLAFSVDSGSHSDTSEVAIELPHHFFACALRGERDEVSEESWNGAHPARHRLSATDLSLFVPRGERFVGKSKGSASFRIITCELDGSAFARILGNRFGGVELQPYCGANLLAPGIAERLEAICLTPGAASLVYAESVALVLVVEIFRAYGAKPSLPDLTAGIGAVRFKLVVDFIEEHLTSDLGLFEMASLTGLGVAHFSHAFKAASGMTPHRYVLQRRMERAKSLLLTTDETIATIAARVGFSDERRFRRTFAKLTGSLPSAHRA
jgi:AraC family transcriptional regulator